MFPFYFWFSFSGLSSPILGSLHSMTDSLFLAIMSLQVFHENRTKDGNPKTTSLCLFNQTFDFGSLGYPHPNSWSNSKPAACSSLKTHVLSYKSLETLATIDAAETTGYLSSAFDSDRISISSVRREPHSSFIIFMWRFGGPS